MDQSKSSRSTGLFVGSTRVFEKAAAEGANAVVVSAGIEAEIVTMPAEDRGEFLAALGLGEAGLARIIRSGYDLLHLITFFTVGPKEARAWTVHKGAKAPEAAGGAERLRVTVLDAPGEDDTRVCERLYGESEFWHADVTDHEAMARVATEVKERFGRVDIVVANAGVANGGPFEDSDPLRPGGPLLPLLRGRHRGELPARRAGDRRQGPGHLHVGLPGGQVDAELAGCLAASEEGRDAVVDPGPALVLRLPLEQLQSMSSINRSTSSRLRRTASTGLALVLPLAALAACGAIGVSRPGGVTATFPGTPPPTPQSPRWTTRL